MASEPQAAAVQGCSDDAEAGWVQVLPALGAHLDPVTAARAACVSRTWRGAAANAWELHWRTWLQQDWGWAPQGPADPPTGPEAVVLGSAREAYYAWRQSFQGYGELGCRAVRAWRGLEAFLEREAPEVRASLRPGATEQQLDLFEAQLAVRLPKAARALYRVHNGQSLEADWRIDCNHRVYSERNAAAAGEGEGAGTDGGDGGGSRSSLRAMGLEEERRAGEERVRAAVGQEVQEREHQAIASVAHGLFGGYSFYDHICYLRMLPLARSAWWTSQMLRFSTPIQSTQYLLACSHDFRRCLVLDCSDGCVSVVSADRALVKCAEGLGDPEAKDNVLCWFEAYTSAASRGEFASDPVAFLDDPQAVSGLRRPVRAMSLFPRQAPRMREAVTRGVRVRVSTVFVPELSSCKPPGRRLVFAYSVRFWLLPEEQQALAPGRSPMKSCQLRARHWIIRGPGGEQQEQVSGEGVIGQYPLLLAGAQEGQPGAEFVYQSCTQQTEWGCSMGGHFVFVPRSLENPEGEEFDVECPSFDLMMDTVIF